MPLLIFPILFLLIPAAEIAVFIYVGQAIGVWKVIAFVFASAILGILLMRMQGLSAMRSINRDMREGRAPEQGLMDGVLVVIGAVLLIVPGFITDFFGLLLMLPPVRKALWAFVRSRIAVTRFDTRGGPRRRRADDVVDLDADDFERTDRPVPPRSRLDHDD